MTEELVMGNAIVMTLPDAAVGQLAADPNVVSIIPRYDGNPPPSTIADGTSAATGMNSDYWRPWNDGNAQFFYLVTLDTGIRSAHTVFTSPDRGTLGLHLDCSRGNDSCANSPVNPAYNDQDSTWNHGTAVGSILIGGNSSALGFGIPLRGVTKAELDYLNVYSATGSDPVAVGRAYKMAVLWGDDIVVGELQMAASDNSAPSLAADDAFDLGIATVAACGNNDAGLSGPASPGNAHKAMSIGDYDASTGAVNFQVPGLVDGRIKPDFQAPTSVEAASSISNVAKKASFGGTSASTAFGGGAAALLFEWYSSALGITNKPGNLYTGLLAQGNAGNMPGPTNGTGKLKMEGGSHWWSGSVTLGSLAMDVPIPIPASRKNLKVAIWWPEKQSDAHNDVDLMVLDQAGVVVNTSVWSSSVWEKVVRNGNLTPGTYTVRFIPYSLPRPNQVVYYTVIASLQ